jgi:hypothetical protein
MLDVALNAWVDGDGLGWAEVKCGLEWVLNSEGWDNGTMGTKRTRTAYSLNNGEF